MDEIVRAALAKWPNVPHCHGWLALDARGDWYMRDDRVRAAGPFPQVKGSPVRHPQLAAFIGRNYQADGDGQWFFQNGPQRVYVELEAAPWVWRLASDDDGDDSDHGNHGNHGATGRAPRVSAHTGVPAQARSAWLDEHGRVFLDTDLGFGLVHSLDVAHAADAVERGVWQPRTLPFAEMPARFGYRRVPGA